MTKITTNSASKKTTHTEYVISASGSSDDWFDNVISHKGIKEITRDLQYLMVESSPKIAEELKLKYPYLKIELVYI